MRSPSPLRLSTLGFCLLFMMCLSFEARGDGTEEEDLSPGIKLRIESCGYEPTTNVVSDDDDSATDESGDDDDSASDDDDSAGSR